MNSFYKNLNIFKKDNYFEANFYNQIFTYNNEIINDIRIKKNNKVIEKLKFVFEKSTSKIIISTNAKSDNYSKLFKIIFHDFFVAYYTTKYYYNNNNEFVEIVWDKQYNKFFNVDKIIINHNYVIKRKELLEKLIKYVNTADIKNMKILHDRFKVVWSVEDYTEFIHFVSDETINWMNSVYPINFTTLSDYCGAFMCSIANSFMKREEYCT